MNNLNPIKNEKHHNRVMQEIKQMMLLEKLNKEESDYLSKLIDLVQEYKDKNKEDDE